MDIERLTGSVSGRLCARDATQGQNMVAAAE